MLPVADSRPPLDVAVRAVTLDDAPELASLYAAQRSFLAPFEPIRPDAFFTEAGQREGIREAVDLSAAGRGQRFVIEAEDRALGVIAVSNIVRGAFLSGSVGYFVAEEWNGRGIATRAVGLVRDWAFGAAGLHRLEAATLTDEIGVSRRYLRIAGEWRDHVLFATTVEDSGGAEA